MKFLIDEMCPRQTACILYEDHGHDAEHVHDLGLQGVDDHTIAAFARTQGRAVVTENVVDFVDEHDLVVIFVLKRNLPSGGAQANALAQVLDTWANDNPKPYVGHHWP